MTKAEIHSIVDATIACAHQDASGGRGGFKNMTFWELKFFSVHLLVSRLSPTALIMRNISLTKLNAEECMLLLPKNRNTQKNAVLDALFI